MQEFSLSRIHRAAEVLASHVVRTPLLCSPFLDAELNCRMFVKAESLQATGSFKLRGALNKVLSLHENERRNGVIAFSAGNHGQAVAAAARLVGCPAIIVLPNGAPKIKIDRCRWWGAEVVLYNPETEDRATIAAAIADRKGMTLVHPFDDLDVMAGQGTVGLEIVEQVSRQAVRPDALIVNCSGGGLASGVVTAVRASFPDVSVYLAEISGSEKWRRALISRQPEQNERPAQTVMDGINGPVVGTKPLAAMLEHKDTQSISVTDNGALAAMRLAFENFKLVLEPGGAASLSVAMTHGDHFKNKNVLVVSTGGNVDAEVFRQALDQ